MTLTSGGKDCLNIAQQLENLYLILSTKIQPLSQVVAEKDLGGLKRRKHQGHSGIQGGYLPRSSNIPISPWGKNIKPVRHQLRSRCD